MATLAAAREAWLPAVRLFAKAEALLQAEAAAFSLPARDHYERAHARAREALGDEASQAAAAAGRALTLEQALVEAEAVLERDRDEGAGGAMRRRSVGVCAISPGPYEYQLFSSGGSLPQRHFNPLPAPPLLPPEPGDQFLTLVVNQEPSPP